MCKWCGCNSTAPNPLQAHTHALAPTIPWARNRGAECRPCVNYRRIMWPDTPAAQIEKRLREVKGFRDDFMLGRERYCKSFVAMGNGHINKDEVTGGLATAVTAESHSGMTVTQNCGYLWPPDVWNRHFPDKQIQPGDLQTIMTAGNKKSKVLSRTLGPLRH